MTAPIALHPHVRILAHALGIEYQQDRREPNEYRNHYVCNEGEPEVTQLVDAGLMVLASRPTWTGGLVQYAVTEAGKEQARAFWKARQWPKKKRVYARFLAISDYRERLTFREFLTKHEYAECRRSA